MCRVYGDHPRVCGEQLCSSKTAIASSGSPPRVRGTEQWHEFPPEAAGITPACAGNRLLVHDLLPQLQDHPRVCGEQLNQTCDIIGLLGSPPRVRGTANPNCKRARTDGITPACAGNSFSLSLSIIWLKDHPRVCGEQYKKCDARPYHTGSPPRVRGTENAVDDGDVAVGITPACAGNRPGRPCRPWAGWDHPRVCGEQIPTIDIPVEVMGSPPRVRGTVLVWGRGDPRRRITPACAGNSPGPHPAP